MANKIKIKRSQTTATPTSLDEGELAYSELSSNLFIGKQGGNIEAIAGAGTFAKINEVNTALAGKANTSHTHDDRYYTEGETDTLLSSKANIASPTFTGQPSAPTPASSDNSTRLATTAFVQGEIASFGAGDMSKAVYDTDNDGKVNSAEDADQLGGQLPSHYLNYNNLTNKPTLGTASALNTGTTNGTVPVIGVGDKLPTSIIPAIAMTDVFTVASQSAQLALAAEEGDVAVRTDIGRTYIHNGGTAGTMADWAEMSAIGQVQSVNGQTGAVNLGKTDVGLGSVSNDAQLKIASNLSDLADAASARSNLGLGSAATSASTDFTPASHASNTNNPHGVTAAQVGLGNVTNHAQLKIASNLSDLNDAAAARQNLGIGSMGTQAANDVAITGGSVSNLTTFDGNTIDGGTF